MIYPESFSPVSSPVMDHLQNQDIHAAQPMSRTHQYRKVMKPLLERKRRARINQCIEELKDLMVNALQSEGESITKLEKADVLELTVKHLRKLKKRNALGLTPQATYAGKFKAGYTHCAQEVSRFMTAAPLPVDVHISTRLVSHLNSCIQAMEVVPSTTVIPPRLDLLSPPATTDPDQALDLSAKRRRSSCSTTASSSLSVSGRIALASSDDSGRKSGGEESGEDSNNNSSGDDDKASWRPW